MHDLCSLLLAATVSTFEIADEESPLPSGDDAGGSRTYNTYR